MKIPAAGADAAVGGGKVFQGWMERPVLKTSGGVNLFVRFDDGQGEHGFRKSGDARQFGGRICFTLGLFLAHSGGVGTRAARPPATTDLGGMNGLGAGFER